MLFDDLVRSRQHIRRNRQADLLGRFQVDDQLELGRLLHHNELISSAVQFAGDVLGSDSHLRPRGNLLAFQVVAQLRHVAVRGIPRVALFFGDVKAVCLGVSQEGNGERLRTPGQG